MLPRSSAKDAAGGKNFTIGEMLGKPPKSKPNDQDERGEPDGKVPSLVHSSVVNGMMGSVFNSNGNKTGR